MNEHQKHRFTKRIISCLFNTLTGKKLAVLGFAFKKDTSDTRESPSITLVTNFVAEKARVAIYDPKVKEDQIWLDLVNEGGRIDTLKRYVEVCQSAYQACEAADAVVVVTEWDEFSNKSKPETSDLANTRALTEMDSNRTPIATKMRNGNGEAQEMKTDGKARLDWAQIAARMRKPMFVFDGRNILDAAKLEKLGFRVEAIGRASKKPYDLGNYE